MPITSPVAIKFISEQVRTFADKLAQLDSDALDLVNWWSANGGAALVPNTVGNIVADQAAPNGVDATGGDGRPVIDGAKVNNIINRAIALRSTAANAGLAMGVAGVRDSVLQVAVNPKRS
jgi:hypothetical protein